MARINNKCWVVMLEHYHFPPNDSDMVACRCLGVWAGNDKGRITAKEYALGECNRHAERFQGVIERYPPNDEDKDKELRVWVKSDNEHCDKFVWVVKQVNYHI